MDQNNFWGGVVGQIDIQASQQPVASRGGFQRSEGTGILHINMNSHDNQGIIIGIPLMDQSGNLLFIDWVMECDNYFKMQNGDMGSGTRRLLSIDKYKLEDQSDINEYNSLRDRFKAIYQNRDMLTKTDWNSSIRNPQYFGMYMWVISHMDTQNKQRVDKDGVPHCGQNGSGRLAFVQFKNSSVMTAWQTFLQGYAAMQQQPQQVYMRVFSDGSGRVASDGFRPSALMISYRQDDSKQNKPFSCTIMEKFFNDPNGLAGFVNERGVNPNAYHIYPEQIEGAKDLAKEFLNTDIADSLWKDASVNDFRRALKAIENCFDFYQAVNADASEENKKKYDDYVHNCGYNESSQANAAQQIANPVGTTVAPGVIPTAPVGGTPVAPGVIPTMPQANPIPPQTGQPVIPGTIPGTEVIPQSPRVSTQGLPNPEVAAPTVPGMSVPAAPSMPGVIPGGFPQVPQNPQWTAGNPGIPGQS